MSAMFGGKNQWFTFYTPSEIEFIQPANEANYRELKKAQHRHINDPSGEKSLVEMHPEDSRQGINRRAENYHDLTMLYKNPSASYDERQYCDGVLVYKSEPSEIAGYNVVQVPRERKRDAVIIKQQLESRNPPVRDVKTNRIIAGAYMETTRSLSFDEVPDNPDDDSQLVANPKQLNKKEPAKK